MQVAYFEKKPAFLQEGSNKKYSHDKTRILWAERRGCNTHLILAAPVIPPPAPLKPAHSDKFPSAAEKLQVKEIYIF